MMMIMTTRDSSRLVHVTVIVIAPYVREHILCVIFNNKRSHRVAVVFCVHNLLQQSLKQALKRLINFQLSEIKTIFSTT